MEYQKLLTEVKELLIEKGAEKLILFGSMAWDRPTEESDIDLLVIKDLPKASTRDFRIDLKKALWKKFKNLNMAFDIIVDSEERIQKRIAMGDLFYKEIYTKGKILHA